MAAARLPVIRRSRAAVRVAVAASVLGGALACPGALAHGLSDNERSAPAFAQSFAWSVEPWIVALLALSVAAYSIGYLRLRRRSRGRGAASGPANGPSSGLRSSARNRQMLAFIAGCGTLAIALLSPLDTLSGALFSAHMVQHEALMLIAAPLCVAGRPLAVWLWALPRRARLALGALVRARGFARAWRWLSAPLVAWLLHAAALWAWHAPALFEAALAHRGVHALQHASFLLSALLFWWTVTGDGARRGNGGHAMLSLFTTMVHTSALGALTTLAPGLWYPSYVESCSALGIDPLHDQQLGGLIMWVPGALAYLAGALLVAARWLSRAERRPAFMREAARAQREGAR
ncbi:cytochrome c oxidase assembly protein [Paraburkholderia sp. MMS20-SJTR3]|uniref:Cytochrome c oxidase assembly protein n=1 Tax=Paraburkholderia sejongensis TaxID=2886946 RepID=A0ABS8JQT6_9BURK|nr:cytochrome c oxidase assembly protein [Paraburkholderia sp. MMS20-SJTR3]MCC8392279.1 cytochrome c oxidase assembly protein [Paraburkholderia sp. MMS20-SJTR3]